MYNKRTVLKTFICNFFSVSYQKTQQIPDKLHFILGKKSQRVRWLIVLISVVTELQFNQ